MLPKVNESIDVERLAEEIVTTQKLNDRKPIRSWAGEHCLRATLDATHGWLARHGYGTDRLLGGFKVHFAAGAPESSIATAAAKFFIGTELTKVTVTWRIPGEEKYVARFIAIFLHPLQFSVRNIKPRGAKWVVHGRGSTIQTLNSLAPEGWQRLMKSLLDQGRIAMAEYENRVADIGLYPVTNVHLVVALPIHSPTGLDLSLANPEKRNSTHDIPIRIVGPSDLEVGIARVRVSSPAPAKQVT